MTDDVQQFIRQLFQRDSVTGHEPRLVDLYRGTYCRQATGSWVQEAEVIRSSQVRAESHLDLVINIFGAVCGNLIRKTTTDAMMCRGFLITLTGSARSWYRQLKPNSIGSFAELSRLFLTQFISGKKSRKPNTHLFTIKQKPKESLKEYIARFNEEALQVEDYDDKIALSVVFEGLKEGRFTFSIGKNPLKTLTDLIAKSQKYTNIEKFSNARKNVQVTELTGKGKRPRNEESQPSSKGPDDRTPRDRRSRRKPEEKFYSYTPFNTSTKQILLDIKGHKLLNWPVCMKADPDHRDKRKYCRFHRDHGHNTAECVDPKDEIETLIRKGHLCQYAKGERTTRKEE
ncbi:uncharacterized protein LOC131228834 [Magnolia sinica]|uniref:uncharacterized protein LOC131228834 n=1 Tax=Magnolia sinica TaxID=86752 RepID=UPI002658076E|nr:uncharacterized protein LOC131228834 [Magnolia sinica]